MWLPTLQTKKCGQTSKSDLQPPQLKGRSLNELAPAGMENWMRMRQQEITYKDMKWEELRQVLILYMLFQKRQLHYNY
jgi:hypothetical protein